MGKLHHRCLSYRQYHSSVSYVFKSTRLQAAVELMFQEWLESEEGRDQQQRHADRLQELRNQTQQLQAELEEGGGDRGGLFPQVVIDRNNELARLVRSL